MEAHIDSITAYVTSILRDTQVQPNIEETEIKSLIENDCINIVKNLIALDMRRRDKLEFIALFGDEHVIDMLKKFLPIIYEPLYILYSSADSAGLLNSLFALIKASIAIAEESVKQQQEAKQPPTEIANIAIAKYTEKLKLFEKEVYVYVRTIMMSESSAKILRDIVAWIMGIFEYIGAKSTVDIKQLYAELGTTEKRAVMDDLTKYIDWKAQRLNAFAHVKKAGPAPLTINVFKHLGNPFKQSMRTLFQ
jgi:hypothetical protein